MADDGAQYSWEGADEGGGPASRGVSGGGSTNWMLAIQQMLERIKSMEPETALADAEALQQAIKAAVDASERLARAFDGDGLEGEAATSSSTRASDLAAQIASNANAVSGGAVALGSASGVMSAARLNAPFLQQMQKEMEDKPEDAADIMTRAASLMTASYNAPMSAAASQAPSPGMSADSATSAVLSSGGSVSGGGGGGNSGGGGSRGSAGGSTDLGDYGTTGVKDPNATPAASTSGDQSPPSGTTAGSDKPLSLGDNPSGGGTGGDDPDTLTRGGLGSPNSVDGSTNPAAMMMGPGGVGAGAGAKAVGGAASPGGIGGTNGANGANAASTLSRRLSGAIPTAATSNPVSTTPVGTGSGRVGGTGPMGGTPHGGRARGSDKGEHKAAHYLHTKENGAEIVGSLPLVGPPVIGDWAPPQPLPEPAKPSDTEGADPTVADRPDKDLTL
ncbi:hypothetical protein [Gordonia insulae]|uniref:PPE family domain-containing protein n=1 Tax=Gordonia insulae TaxID=2420509 RepID=A0A3G8JHP1_9ACTN|nr:hypothetical protein [Gordonia insulae]AZG44032.1 hypothetical protein D7316_00612 [Gordonia insulae]